MDLYPIRMVSSRCPLPNLVCETSTIGYYAKPGEDATPPDLAAKGVQAVRGYNAETGELLLPVNTADTED